MRVSKEKSVYKKREEKNVSYKKKENICDKIEEESYQEKKSGYEKGEKKS